MSIKQESKVTLKKKVLREGGRQFERCLQKYHIPL